MPPLTHIVIGVLSNTAGDICIAQRSTSAHQGGLWEFPGGKCEADETPLMALQRELHEELGIQVTQATPLIRLQHDYPDQSVLLDVWQVAAWQGEAWGKEGQPVRWVPKNTLRHWAFPVANQAIIRAIELPDSYLITPEAHDIKAFLQALERSLQTGIKLVQLRTCSLTLNDYMDLAQQAATLCHQAKARLLLNAACATPEHLALTGADGLHLTSTALHQYTQRPVSAQQWLAASCHDSQDIAQAQRLGVDFLVLSPVAHTSSHPHASPLGWQKFQDIVATARCPVYALGGMQRQDIAPARACGAQGIASISGLWAAAPSHG